MTQPFFIQAAQGDTALPYDASYVRRMIAAVSPLSGVCNRGDLQVSARGAGANMSVDVAAGDALVAGGSVTGQGTYHQHVGAVTNVPITSNTSGNPRIDLIALKINDKQNDGGTAYSYTILPVQGTPAASPTVPATPTSAIPLAQVWVPNNAASITASNIVDLRTLTGTGDIPSWQLTGGNGQAIPNVANTAYTGWSFSDLRGITAGSNGQLIVQTPGRYAVTFTIRFTLGGNSGTERALYMQQTRGGSWGWSGSAMTFTPGANYRRVGSVNTMSGSSVGAVLTAAGTARCNQGDTLQALMYQASTVQLNIDDSYAEATFAGYWLGP